MNTQDTYHIAHVRQHDQCQQTLVCHLTEVAALSKQFANKINIGVAGELIGLLHDFGKYSAAFQTYILTATGLLEPDADDQTSQKGKIDHSTAGAQWVWQALSKFARNGNHDEGMLCGQILALCIASHHGSLIDNLSVDGEHHLFKKRIEKLDEQTHLSECQQKGAGILQQAQALASKDLLIAMLKRLKTLTNPSETITYFNRGMWTRFLFSCLIDADRISSADFECAENTAYRQRQKPDWVIAVARLENRLKQFADQPAEQLGPIDPIRRTIANTCLQRATEAQGIYTLTVPTGGGKTLASLRYALHHAQAHQLERVIYVIPYTSIIEQNAKVMREILELEQDEFPWILEHHSNLEPETQTWHSKLAAENWDAPIIVTTMVQFLETLFGGGTRGVRRLHQLANSVIIFDEIQTLPIRCTHLFCNALNFLVQQSRTTAVLCTATQPLLNKLPEQVLHKGQLHIPEQNELMPDVAGLFDQLRRTEVKPMLKSQGWSETEIAELALNELRDKGNCLVIVNTKAWAQKLYLLCRAELDDKTVFHLSTSLCSAHRQDRFAAMRQRLDDKQPVLCISTQLIEAGVDIDFASVIRLLAGLDSIAQAAGRCNRHGHLSKAIVHVVNPTQESIEQLIDIKQGKEHALHVLDDLGDITDVLSPQAISRYFQYYFYDRAGEMDYPVPGSQAARKDTLLSLLSGNDKNIRKTKPLEMRQSFKTAAEIFKAIDAPTESVIVPWGDGEDLITELCGLDPRDTKQHRCCLTRAQKFSVNVFPNDWRKLKEQHAIQPIGNEGIYCLDERYYSPEFGLSTEPVSKAKHYDY